MNNVKRSRTIVPPSYFAKLALPFAVPALLSVALIVLVGDAWPRNIAPGSSLKFAGLGATVVTAWLAWQYAIRGIMDIRAHKMAALLVCVTGLIGWPVWSFGVLPSVNGISLGRHEAVQMTLERTEAIRMRLTRAPYHWAWLKPVDRNAQVGPGRYFISEATYNDLNSRHPELVTVKIAQGLLGAQVVTAVE